jgi:hypothetical protein
LSTSTRWQHETADQTPRPPSGTPQARFVGPDRPSISGFIDHSSRAPDRRVSPTTSPLHSEHAALSTDPDPLVRRQRGRFQCAVETADACRPRRRNSATSVCGERVCRAGCSQPQDQRDRGETGIADGSDAGVWRVVVGEGRLRSSASHPLSRSRSAASARPPPRSPNRRFANSR